MKTPQLYKYLMAILIGLTLYGCVYSVHPLFTNEELVVRNELMGRWQVDDDTIWEFSRGGGHYYTVVHIQEEDTTYLDAGLGMVGDLYFLDFTIGDIDLNDMELFHLFPTHTFAKVTFGDDRIVLEWFATQWLENLIKDKRIRIRHELENKQVLLTASTDELKKFIHKYANEPKAFDEPQELMPAAVQ